MEAIQIKHLFMIFGAFWSLTFVNAANILAIIPLNSPSHFIMFNKLLKTLAERGHNLDVVSHFPQKKPIPGYNDLSIAQIAPALKNNLSVSVVENQSSLRLFQFMIDECGYQPCKQAFETEILKDLRKTTKKYDLLITELFGSDCIFGFAHILKIPAIVSMTTSVNLPWASNRIGNPDNPSYITTYFTNATSKMTLLQRIINLFNLIAANFAYYYYSTEPTRKLCKQFFGPDVPDVEDMIKNTSLIFVNSHFSINQPRPTVPNFLEVGGLHIENPKPIPKKLEDIIRKNKNGFIYLTMGSMVMTESFSLDKLQGMFDAFDELPQTVLWKANKTRFPEGLRFPKNIHFETWLPQLDMLCHPDIKLFVSHGGLLGSQEAVYCGVPRIGIPLFADQELNIHQSIEMGIALKVDYNLITKNSILKAAKEIIRNDKYRNNAKRISGLFKDRQNSPLDTAIYWTEYVIKYGGAPHLRSAGADLPWYQYYLVDAALIVILILVIIFYILFIITREVVYLFIIRDLAKLKTN